MRGWSVRLVPWRKSPVWIRMAAATATATAMAMAMATQTLLAVTAATGLPVAVRAITGMLVREVGVRPRPRGLQEWAKARAVTATVGGEG